MCRSEKKEDYDAVFLSEKFREEINWIKKKVLRLKERYYECFVKHKEVPKVKIESKLCLVNRSPIFKLKKYSKIFYLN